MARTCISWYSCRHCVIARFFCNCYISQNKLTSNFKTFNMNLIKLEQNNWVLVSDELIQEGDYYINTEGGSPYSDKIYRGMPVSLKNGYAGKGFKDPCKPDIFEATYEKV